MKILASYDFTDYNQLNEYFLLEAIKNMCEFDSINEPYMISIEAKSFHYEKGTITYSVNILELNNAV